MLESVSPDDLKSRLTARLGAPSAALDRAATVAGLRAFVDAEREALNAEFRRQPTGMAYCVAHSRLYDLVLAELFELAQRLVTEHLGAAPDADSLCVAAVGGYGRRTMSPWSDIDVAFIPAHEGHEHIDAMVREMMALLGDTLLPRRHPSVAHSYRPLSDLGLIDHQTATALLESRPVAGDQGLHGRFVEALMDEVEPVEFMHRNRAERRAVWRDRRQSLFAVEPNLKGGPGGLRDFHAAIWVVKAALNIPEWDVLEAIRWRGLITEEERAEVLTAVEFLTTCRNWLHLARGQKLDVLHVTYQPEMAEGLGYRPAEDEMVEEGLMRDYFHNARVIARFAERLFIAAEQQRLDYRDGMYVEGRTLYPQHDGIFAEDPTRLVKVYEHNQRLELRLSLPLQRLIAANVDRLDAAVRERRETGASLLAILGSECDVAGTLRAMLHSGVLERVLPELGPLMTFLPFDPAHEYSVGEHSMKVVEEMQRLRDHPRDEIEHHLSDAVRALKEPEVLMFAGLFHDIGKLDRSGAHSLTGLPVARAVAERLGMAESAIERVEFLIREHLQMMRTARLRALSLPETIAEFVAILPRQEPLDALDMLTVLTCGDTRSVGENVLRDTDRLLLMELFGKAAKWIQERPLLGDEPVPLDQATRRLQQAPALRDMEPELVRRHLASMPAYYVANTPPALIGKHISYVERCNQGEDPVVEFYRMLGTRHTELTLCTIDRLGLLRDIAAAVSANNLDIYLAHLDVCSSGCEPRWSIATIWVDDFGQPLGQAKCDRLRKDLVSILSNQETAEEVLVRREKVVPEQVLLERVEVNNHASRQHTVVVFRAGDQRGLLYRLTSALAAENLAIRVAKVTTWHGAAEDAFYLVSGADGQKLDDDEAAAAAQRLAGRLSDEPVEVLQQ